MLNECCRYIEIILRHHTIESAIPRYYACGACCSMPWAMWGGVGNPSCRKPFGFSPCRIALSYATATAAHIISSCGA